MAEYTYTQRFHCCLEGWLNEGNNRASEIYRSWNTKRPSEANRKLIVGILNALYDLHKKGMFHGALKHHENYAITFLPNYSGSREYSETMVWFLSKNMVHWYEGKDIRTGQTKDLEAVTKVIFDHILGGYEEYPSDLQSLRQTMITESCCTRFIANHPSLWHWRRRYFFFGEIWILLKGASDRHRYFIETTLDALNGTFANWQSKIPKKTPIEELFNAKFYRRDAMGLLRFLRTLFENIFKEDRNGRKKYIDEVTEKKWLDMQYIEHKVTKMFPLFLVDFCEQLSRHALHF